MGDTKLACLIEHPKNGLVIHSICYCTLGRCLNDRALILIGIMANYHFFTPNKLLEVFTL